LTEEERDHYEGLAERLERLAYDLRQRSPLDMIDVLEAAQFIRDRLDDRLDEWPGVIRTD
jgi:hypothetical protein